MNTACSYKNNGVWIKLHCGHVPMTCQVGKKIPLHIRMSYIKMNQDVLQIYDLSLQMNKKSKYTRYSTSTS